MIETSLEKKLASICNKQQEVVAITCSVLGKLLDRMDTSCAEYLILDQLRDSLLPLTEEDAIEL